MYQPKQGMESGKLVYGNAHQWPALIGLVKLGSVRWQMPINQAPTPMNLLFIEPV